MKKVLAIIFVVLVYSQNTQAQSDISIFHRLLIFNSNNEMMVVKIENRNFWVTPGLYQSKEQSIKSGLDSIASTYGVDLKEIKLKGTFILKRDLNGKRSTSLRNVYTATVKNISEKKPKGIDKIIWLSPEKALKQITFPHINAMIEQITRNPDQVWGGTLLQFRENDLWKTKILEEFYAL